MNVHIQALLLVAQENIAHNQKRLIAHWVIKLVKKHTNFLFSL